MAPTGRIRARFSTEQRDLFIHAPATPPSLGHLLHRTPVREGKLNVRLSRSEVDTLIGVAAALEPKDKREDRALQTLLRYLEGLEERFESDDDERDA